MTPLVPSHELGRSEPRKRGADKGEPICICPVAIIDAMGDADLTDARCPLHGDAAVQSGPDGVEDRHG